MLRRLLIPIGAALVVAACGGSDEGKLSAAQAERLTGYVDRAQAAYDKSQCANARSEAGEGARRVARLKGGVDEDLRQNLIDGFNQLEQELAAGCDKPEEEETPTPDPTVEVTATPEPTASPVPTPEPTVTEVPTVTPEPTVAEEPTVDTGGAVVVPEEE